MSNLKFYLLFFCSAIAVFTNTVVFADNPASNYPLDFYFGLGAGQSDFEFSEDADIDIDIGKIKAGVFIQENIALEFNFGQGLRENKLKNSNLSVEVDSWFAAMIRLQSPHLNGFRIYFQGGYSEVELSQTDALTPANNSDDTLNGATWSVGAEQKFNKTLPLWFYVDFNRINDTIRTNIIDAGIRFGLD